MTGFLSRNVEAEDTISVEHLLAACNQDHPNVARLLLMEESFRAKLIEKGSQIYSKHNGQNAMHAACFQNWEERERVEIIEALLSLEKAAVGVGYFVAFCTGVFLRPVGRVKAVLSLLAPMTKIILHCIMPRHLDRPW